MPHGNTSCRNTVDHLVQCELELLYARRAEVEETIRELEVVRSLWLMGQDHAPAPKPALEFAANPCNLTNCRNA
jgi:hypothetical protein